MGKGWRRLFWLSAVGGVGFAGWTVWSGRREASADPAPEWPPLDPPDSATVAAAVPTADDPAKAESAPAAAAGFAGPAVDDQAAPRADARWVEPVDGECPVGYPIKANDNSGIYHVPTGRFYDRTVPERCYASADEAAADGYRAAKA